MATKSYPKKTSFNGGVQTPKILGMVDAPKGDSSFQAGLNGIGTKYGPWARRGGTKIVTQSNSFGGSGKKTQLVRFIFNDTQAYILEFGFGGGTGLLRVYKDRGVVLKDTTSAVSATYTAITRAVGASITTLTVADSSIFTVGKDVSIVRDAANSDNIGLGLDGKIASVLALPSSTTVKIDTITLPYIVPGTMSGTNTITEVFEVTIPYSGNDMFASDGTFRLDVRQINDVMYIDHPDHPTKVLARTAHDAWTVTDMKFNKGPFEPENLNTDKRLVTVPWRREIDQDSLEIWISEITTKTLEDTGNPFNLFSATDCISTANGGWNGATDSSGIANGGTGSKGNRQFKLFITDLSSGERYRWRYVTIVKYISATEVWITRDEDEPGWATGDPGATVPGNSSGSPVNQWALGAFSDTSGYPETIEIHAGRLALGNTASQPRQVSMSVSGAFTSTSSDWETADRDGQVYDDLGLSLTIGAGNSSPIQWLSSTQAGLAVGSFNEEGMLRPSDETKGFVPGSVVYSSETTIGSKSIQPIRINQSTLFVSKTGRRIHEMSYDLTNNGQSAPDLTRLAEHVTKTGIIDFAWQREPIDVLWCVLADGKLIGMTFDKDENITGWHQHELGGEDVSGYAPAGLGGEHTTARSVAVIPTPDGLSEEVWIAVDREGNTLNYSAPVDSTQYAQVVVGSIEIMQPIHESDTDIKDAKLLDSYLDKTVATVSKTTTNNAGAVSGLANGSIYYITNPVPATGFTDDPTESYLLVDGAQFKSLAGGILDFGQTFTADTQLTSTVFTGGDIFLGKTISLYADGRKLPDQTIDQITLGAKVSKTTTTNDGTVSGLIDNTIYFLTSPVPATGYSTDDPTNNYFIWDTSSGKLVEQDGTALAFGQTFTADFQAVSSQTTLSNGAQSATLTIGYPYTSFVELKNLEGGDLSNLTQGKTKRVTKVMVRLLDSLGLKFGDSATTLDTYEFDEDQEISDFYSLKSGDYILDWPGEYERSGTIRLQGDGPFPLQIQLVVAEMETQGFQSSR